LEESQGNVDVMYKLASRQQHQRTHLLCKYYLLLF